MSTCVVSLPGLARHIEPARRCIRIYRLFLPCATPLILALLWGTVIFAPSALGVQSVEKRFNRLDGAVTAGMVSAEELRLTP